MTGARGIRARREPTDPVRPPPSHQQAHEVDRADEAGEVAKHDDTDFLIIPARPEAPFRYRQMPMPRCLVG